MAYKSGYIAIIGKPNAGKSTFINKLLNFKISIVSPRPQTTRRRVMGIYSGDEYQIVFLDTPGILDPQYELQRKMMQYVRESLDDADAILWIIDAGAKQPLDEKVALLLKNSKKPLIAAVNKIDLVNKSDLLPLINKINRDYQCAAIVPVSALKGDGIDDLMKELMQKIPTGMPFYPPDQISEHPERFFVAELIREQTFFLFREEIPFALEVVVDELTERKGRKDFVRATIYVERDSQKGIIIGKGGASLKKLGEGARKQIEDFLGREVYLEIFVKVLEKWRRKSSKLRSLGYL